AMDPSLSPQQQQQRAKELIDQLNYGKDGYFFIYQYDGTNLVLPPLPDLVGTNLWHQQDSQGQLLVQDLIQLAKDGGGFYRYHWPKPSNNVDEEKLSYATQLEPWDWMFGTGVYLDDTREVSEAFLSELRQSTKSTSTLILTVTLSSLVLVAWIGFAINLSDKRNADTKLQQLIHSVIQFQEDERSRVARELHDGIIQLLVSGRFQIQAAEMHLEKKSDGAPAHLKKGIATIHEAITEIKRISKGLRPASLDDLGLGAALQILVTEYGERTGINATISYFDDIPRHDSKIETTYYRIAQEALTNIDKYAQATNVVIRFRVSERSILMTIKDDGIGFNVEKVSRIKHLDDSGTGIRNMQERIEFLGGQFSLFSAENKGTIIKIKLDFDNYIFQQSSVESAHNDH
ncbi:MAG: cache domain-containing protein, partial [Gammaproteobacteria bacterium]|nr:cache domain-containing protein [Gammaproteobacteria bacterium]